MRLYVFLFQAKDLPLKNSYVKLQVGMFKSKTKILKNTTNPVWNQEFLFRVHDVDEEVVVSVFHHEDDSGFFNLSGELMGRVRIPVCSVAAEDNQILPPTWFSIERRPKNGKCFGQDCGQPFSLCLSIYAFSSWLLSSSCLMIWLNESLEWFGIKWKSSYMHIKYICRYACKWFLHLCWYVCIHILHV